VIDETGKNIGALETWKAIELAKEKNLDLIEIVPSLSPPICKIMDYGKFLYKEEKKERAQRVKQKGGETKGIRFGIRISVHDLEIRVNQTEKFLKEGNRVRIEMVLRGREKALGDFARQKLEEFLELTKQKIEFKVEQEPKRTPQGINMVITKA